MYYLLFVSDTLVTTDAITKFSLFPFTPPPNVELFKLSTLQSQSLIVFLILIGNIQIRSQTLKLAASSMYPTQEDELHNVSFIPHILLPFQVLLLRLF